MKCPNCGQEMRDDSKFCITCGQRLFGDAQKNRNKTPLIIGLGIFAILLIIGVACMLLWDPFGRNDCSDIPVTSEKEMTENVPRTTEPIQPSLPKRKLPNLPENSRAIGVHESDKPGLPMPDVEHEVLQAAAELYWTFLGKNEKAQAYGLIDFLGDDIPELIVQESSEEGDSCFSIYYISNDQIHQLKTDTISATSDVQLLSRNGTLMVCYAKGYINWVAVDKSLRTNVKLIKTEEVPKYADSSMLVSVSDKGLLNLSLLGNCDKFSETGWIRADGTDYYYKNGKPLTNQWLEENGILYYLGDQACITKIADQTMISAVIDVYFDSYQTAFNEKNADLLEYATENNREEEGKRFATEENRSLTLSDMRWETTLRKGNDINGSIFADVHLEYIQCGEWKNAEDTATIKEYSVMLVWDDGQWLVEHIGNR